MAFADVKVYTTSPNNYGGSYAGQDYTVYFVHPKPSTDGIGNVLALDYKASRGSNCDGRYHVDGFDIATLYEVLTGVPPSHAVEVTDETAREFYHVLLNKKFKMTGRR